MVQADGSSWLPSEQTRNPIDQAILTAAPSSITGPVAVGFLDDIDRASPALAVAQSGEIPIHPIIEMVRVGKHSRAGGIGQTHPASRIDGHAGPGDIHQVAPQGGGADKTDASGAFAIEPDQIGGIGAIAQDGIAEQESSPGRTVSGKRS